MAVRVRAGVGGTAAVVKCSAPTPRLCDTQHATRERGARRGARAAPVALQLFGFREGGGESRKRGAQVHRPPFLAPSFVWRDIAMCQLPNCVVPH